MPNCTCCRALIVRRLENGVDCNDRVVRWRGFVSPLVRGVVGCHSLHLPRTQEICPHPLAKDVKVRSWHDEDGRRLYVASYYQDSTLSLASHPLFLEAFLEANFHAVDIQQPLMGGLGTRLARVWYRDYVSLVPRPTPQGGRVWEITLLRVVQLECHGFWIQQTSSFRSSTRLVLYYSNFQNFDVLPYIRFLSLVKLERWLAGLTFFPSSTQPAAFRLSRHFRA